MQKETSHEDLTQKSYTSKNQQVSKSLLHFPNHLLTIFSAVYKICLERIFDWVLRCETINAIIEYGRTGK